jgi:hypothetical protein
MRLWTLAARRGIFYVALGGLDFIDAARSRHWEPTVDILPTASGEGSCGRGGLTACLGSSHNRLTSAEESEEASLPACPAVGSCERIEHSIGPQGEDKAKVAAHPGLKSGA